MKLCGRPCGPQGHGPGLLAIGACPQHDLLDVSGLAVLRKEERPGEGPWGKAGSPPGSRGSVRTEPRAGSGSGPLWDFYLRRAPHVCKACVSIQICFLPAAGGELGCRRPPPHPGTCCGSLRTSSPQQCSLLFCSTGISFQTLLSGFPS